MPKRALANHRPWLLASLACALAYFYFGPLSAIVETVYLAEMFQILLKGGACTFLAFYAIARFRGADAKLLALYLAICAAADMALVWSLEIGGGLFFVAHLAAISLYLRNKRQNLAPSQKLFTAVLLLFTPIICWLLSGRIEIGLYGLALGGMAAGAWASRFPRYRVGLGAVLFVISDFLIFAGMGPLEGDDLAGTLVWPIYYSAQFLIATGVIRTLRGELKASTD